MHKSSLFRKIEEDTAEHNEDTERQDRLAKVLMYHSKAFNQSEIVLANLM
jgi:hypothetical protein